MILNGDLEGAIPLLESAVEVADARGDAESALRLEAQLCLVTQRPLPEARSRLARYVERIPPDSLSGRLAAALESEWHAYDGTAADAVAAARVARSPATG